MFYTYILINSLDSQPFYVGKGTGDRAYVHERDALRDEYDYRSVHRKIQSIRKKGGKVLVEKFDQVDEASAFKLEMELIAKYGRKDLKTGCLCNLTDGGEGAVGRSKESVERTAVKHRGMKRSEASKQRMRSAQLKIKEELMMKYGQKRSPESIAKQSARTRGTKWSDAARAVVRAKPTARPVLAYHKDTGVLMSEFESCSAAARALNADCTTIWKICEDRFTSKGANGKVYPLRSHKGYTFKYKLA